MKTEWPASTGEVLRKCLAPATLKVDQQSREVTGLASTWSKDRVNDVIQPGAFGASIKTRHDDPMRTTGRSNIRVLWQHSDPIGVLQEVKETPDGLLIRARVSKTRQGDDIMELLRDGAVDRMSIGFNVTDSEPGPDGSRIIKGMDLWEVSFVTFPANEEARILSVKSAAQPQGMMWLEVPLRYESLEPLTEKSAKDDEEDEEMAKKPVAEEKAQPEDTKAGRAFSRANAEKLQSAMRNAHAAYVELSDALRAGGIALDLEVYPPDVQGPDGTVATARVTGSPLTEDEPDVDDIMDFEDSSTDRSRPGMAGPGYNPVRIENPNGAGGPRQTFSRGEKAMAGGYLGEHIGACPYCDADLAVMLRTPHTSLRDIGMPNPPGAPAGKGYSPGPDGPPGAPGPGGKPSSGDRQEMPFEHQGADVKCAQCGGALMATVHKSAHLNEMVSGGSPKRGKFPQVAGNAEGAPDGKSQSDLVEALRSLSRRAQSL